MYKNHEHWIYMYIWISKVKMLLQAVCLVSVYIHLYTIITSIIVCLHNFIIGDPSVYVMSNSATFYRLSIFFIRCVDLTNLAFLSIYVVWIFFPFLNNVIFEHNAFIKLLYCIVNVLIFSLSNFSANDMLALIHEIIFGSYIQNWRF